MIGVTRQRMRSQCLAGEALKTPESVVYRLGAMQCQDFGPGKWSIAQRTDTLTEAVIDQAFAAGKILRTHVLRPTWHFVLPDDIQWMLELTAPRVHTLNASFYRKQGLDSAIFHQSTIEIASALEGGRHLTRTDLARVLDRSGIPTDPLRLTAIVMNAELNGIICSGEPRGKQQTYVLLDERAPQARHLNRDDALAELTLRYFTGHGPATVKDFVWWSSLTVTDVKRGLDMVALRLEHVVLDGTDYWFAGELARPGDPAPAVQLVQGYDEYIVGYGDSKYLADISGLARSHPRPRGIYTHAVIRGGQIAGQWKAVVKHGVVTVEVTLFTTFNQTELQDLYRAVQRYGAFLALPAELVLSTRS